MACFLALESGGNLLLEDGSGSLLLEFCANDNQQVTPGPYNSNGRYSWELTSRYRLDQEKSYQDKLARIDAERKRNEALLSAKNAEIARLEAKRAEDLANQVMQIELLDMMRQFQAMEQQKLELEALIRLYRDEEDAIMVILLSLPFVG